MASGDAIAVPGNQVIELAGVLSKILPSFFGKTTTEQGAGTSNAASTEAGATTGASKKSLDPATQESLDKLLGTSMTNATSTTQTDTIVQGIFRKAAEAFAPTLGQQNQAGVHNSSVNALLRNDAIARATEDASTAVLGAQQKAADTAAGLLKTSAEGNASVASTGTNNAAKTGASSTTENKSSTTKPTLLGTDPVTALLVAGLTSYAGGKLKKFAEPYLDRVFGSDGGTAGVTSGINGADLLSYSGTDANGMPLAGAGSGVDTAGAETGATYTMADTVGTSGEAGAGTLTTTIENPALSDATAAVTGGVEGATTSTLGADGAAGLVGTGAGGVNQYAQFASIDNSAPVISEADTAAKISSLAGDGAVAGEAGAGVTAASVDASGLGIGSATGATAGGDAALGASALGGPIAIAAVVASMLGQDAFGDGGSADRSGSIAAFEAVHGPGSYAKFNDDRTNGTGDFAPDGVYGKILASMNANVQLGSTAG